MTFADRTYPDRIIYMSEKKKIYNWRSGMSVTVDWSATNIPDLGDN